MLRTLLENLCLGFRALLLECVDKRVGSKTKAAALFSLIFAQSKQHSLPSSPFLILGMPGH
jgi:hypothetical protein